MKFIWDGFIPLEEAVEVSGADESTLERWLHMNVIHGRKKLIAGRERWMVHRPALESYLKNKHSLELDRIDKEVNHSRQQVLPDSFHQYWVMVHHYGVTAGDEKFTIYDETVISGSFGQAAENVRLLYGPLALVVQITQCPLVIIEDEWTLEF